MLSELRDIFKSNIKSLEILYLLEDCKPVVRLMVKEEEKDKVIGIENSKNPSGIFGFFKDNKLEFVLSDFKVVKEDKGKVYSDKGVRVPIDSSESGYFFVYVSKDRGKAEDSKKLENEGKHKELGIALGYPSCCSEFFEKHFEEESKRNNDFTLAVLKESDGFKFPFYTNIASRHFDLALLSHFPCSFSCSKSIEIGKKHLEVVKKEDAQAAEIIEGMLKGGVVYTENNGVFLLRYPHVEANRVYYKGVMGSVDNQLGSALKNAEYLDVSNKSRISLDGIEMKNLGFMLFS